MTTITPLYQLNLLLHMCLPYSKSSGFYPYFYNKGFTIKHIENTIPLPQKSIDCLRNLNISRKNVTPELVLSNKNEIILFECKISDFELDVTHHATKQAASYLSLNQNYLTEYFGFSSKDSSYSGKILYGVVPGKEAKVKQTLDKLNKLITQILSESLPHEIFTIFCNDKGTFISINGKKNIKIIDNKIMNNESMFYIIPTDVNGNFDENTEYLLKTQVKNVLRSMVGRGINFSNLVISTTEVCEKINPLWKLLPTHFKKKLKRWINSSLKQWIEELSRVNIKVRYEQQKFYFPNLSNKQKNIIRKLLISDNFFSDETFSSFNSMQLELEI